MGLIADRLDALYVRASVAGGGISGELRGRAGVAVAVAPWVYRALDERSLERHLAALAKVLWATRMREHFAAVSAAFGETVTREPRAVGQRDRAFVQARDRIVARGVSADGRVTIEVRGMREWRVTVANGVLRGPEQAEPHNGLRGPEQAEPHNGLRGPEQAEPHDGGAVQGLPEQVRQAAEALIQDQLRKMRDLRGARGHDRLHHLKDPRGARRTDRQPCCR